MAVPARHTHLSTGHVCAKVPLRGSHLCSYLSDHLTISSQRGSFCQVLLQRIHSEYDLRDQAAKGDEATRRQFHGFVLFQGELYLPLEIEGAEGLVLRTVVLQPAPQGLLDALSNPVDDDLIGAVKLLELTGPALEHDWTGRGKTDMDEVIQRIKNVALALTGLAQWIERRPAD